MRVGIWDNGPYAGFPQHPDLQLQWFVDQTLLIEQQRLAQGTSLDELLNDDRGYGEWAQIPRDLAMRMRGLEPPRGFPHTDLNRARLPIPPHPRPSILAASPGLSRYLTTR